MHPLFGRPSLAARSNVTPASGPQVGGGKAERIWTAQNARERIFQGHPGSGPGRAREPPAGTPAGFYWAFAVCQLPMCS